MLHLIITQGSAKRFFSNKRSVFFCPTICSKLTHDCIFMQESLKKFFLHYITFTKYLRWNRIQLWSISFCAISYRCLVNEFILCFFSAKVFRGRLKPSLPCSSILDTGIHNSVAEARRCRPRSVVASAWTQNLTPSNFGDSLHAFRTSRHWRRKTWFEQVLRVIFFIKKKSCFEL